MPDRAPVVFLEGHMGGRRRLKLADLKAALAAIRAGARILVASPLPLEPGVVALPGSDVTELAARSPMLRVLVRSGHLTVALAPAPALPADLPPRRKRG